MEQPIKVIQIIGGGEYGGAEEHIIQLITNFPKDQIKLKIITFYEAKFSRVLRENGFDVEVLENYQRFDFRLIKGLKSLFQTWQPDIIHTHGVKANFFGRIAAQKSGYGHLITTVHSLLRYDYPNPLSYFLSNLMENSTRNKVEMFIAVSNAIKEQLLKENQPASKIEVVHHGIEINKYFKPEAKNELREELNIPSDAVVVGMIARMVKVKGINDYVNAAAHLLKQNDKYRFVIVGDGPEKEVIKEQISQKGLDKYFYLTGFRSDVGECLASFDCFVSTSLSEGLGLSMIEAMTAEVPVVATGVGGVLDFLVDRENGLLVPVQSPEKVADCINELMTNDELRKKIINQAKVDATNKFSVERMSATTFEIYKKLLR